MTEQRNPFANNDIPGKPSPAAQRRAQEFMKTLNRDPNRNASTDEIARRSMEMLGLDEDGSHKETTEPAPSPQPHLRTSVSLEELHSGTTRRLTMPNGRTIDLTIPKGARHGLTITVKMPDQTFLVAVDQETHPGFQRRGEHLYASHILNPSDPPEGDEHTVSTLTGRVMLKIPPDTPEGIQFRLRSKGMPLPEDPDQHGDLFITVKTSPNVDWQTRQPVNQ